MEDEIEQTEQSKAPTGFSNMTWTSTRLQRN